MIIELARDPSGRRHIGHNIEQLRKLLGLSREELARELAVDLLAVQRIEGKSVVGRQVLGRIAYVFNVLRSTIELTPEDILNFQEAEWKRAHADLNFSGSNTSSGNGGLA
jgi:transcriptional regulator with XRE-family HTH domain